MKISHINFLAVNDINDYIKDIISILGRDAHTKLRLYAIICVPYIMRIIHVPFESYIRTKHGEARKNHLTLQLSKIPENPDCSKF